MHIQGDGMTLRTMTRAEFHAGRQRYVSDPVMDANPYHYDANTVDDAYEKLLAQAETYPVVGIFLIDGTHIGELAFKRINRETNRCELGIMLYDDAFKGQGLGGKAFSLAVDHAFSALGLQAVYADTMGGNLRMQRILARLGFRCYLRLEACYDMGGRMEDRLDYVLRREDWAAQAREGEGVR